MKASQLCMPSRKEFDKLSVPGTLVCEPTVNGITHERKSPFKPIIFGNVI